MTDDNARINAHEEARRGDEAIAAARHLLGGGFFNDTVSRLDYTSSADFSEERARDEISRAERFIAACRPLLDRRW